MAPKATTDPGHWFLRGVQSAIFYYVSLTPCLDYQYKRKRRKEARQAGKAQGGTVSMQPGLIRQPMAFQTNEEWAEELMLGPGPPKGWEQDTLLKRLKKKGIEIPTTTKVAPEMIENSKPLEIEATQSPISLHGLDGSTTLDRSMSTSQELSTDTSRPSSGTDSTTTTTVAPVMDSKDAQNSPVKPTMERRLSTAVEHLKDSLKSTVHSESWNWRRYDREDEVLWGFSERMSRMWNRATNVSSDEKENLSSGRKRAWTNESDRYDYRRARNPAINDLHPPVVSQLPPTRAEAAWMLLPPPSAAVMAGRKRPGAESEPRWPMCIMGRPRDFDQFSKKKTEKLDGIEPNRESHLFETDTSLGNVKLGKERASISTFQSEANSLHTATSHEIEVPNSFLLPPFRRAASAADVLNQRVTEPWQVRHYVPDTAR